MKEFCKKFGVEMPFDEKEVISLGTNVFLASPEHQHMATKMRKEVFSVGLPIGEMFKGKFKPSFVLLEAIAGKTTQIAVVNEKSEWLFICGRDMFKEAVVECDAKAGMNVIVMNSRRECLGYGIICTEGKTYIKNMLDLGDYLRRERLFRR